MGCPESQGSVSQEVPAIRKGETVFQLLSNLEELSETTSAQDVGSWAAAGSGGGRTSCLWAEGWVPRDTGSQKGVSSAKEPEMAGGPHVPSTMLIHGREQEPQLLSSFLLRYPGFLEKSPGSGRPLSC